MKDEARAKIEHLQWAIESRAKNQRGALRLLRLFHEFEEQWKTKKWAVAAQDLLSNSFSLWRAAFLADKTAKRAAVFLDATIFLTKMAPESISLSESMKTNRRRHLWIFSITPIHLISPSAATGW